MEKLSEKFCRKTFIPIVSPDQNETKYDSKFGGKPFISVDNRWPQCGQCNKDMKFFLQLNSDDMPNKDFGEGLLQMFYCVICDNYEPFSKTHKIRIIKTDEIELESSVSQNDEFKFLKIINWQETVDYPTVTELMESENLNDEEYEEFQNSYNCKSGEKLSGWPFWVQGVEYPRCNICAEFMNFIFQIDSESNIDYMFGDMGIGHITQCKNHPTQLTFTWACH